MIKFLKYSNEKPFTLFKEKYDQALLKNQKNIEAFSISSYSKDMKDDSRYVNLKLIDQKILFS